MFVELNKESRGQNTIKKGKHTAFVMPFFQSFIFITPKQIATVLLQNYFYI